MSGVITSLIGLGALQACQGVKRVGGRGVGVLGSVTISRLRGVGG